MIDAGNSYVGSMQRADAARGWPERYVRLVLGEPKKYVNGQYVDGEKTTHQMSAATARKIAKALLAEARIIEPPKKRR